MQIHNYNANTGEFISTAIADESPLEPGVFLVPANATEIAPPAETSGKARVFSNSEWSYIADLRGETYWLADGSEHTVTELGELPDGALTENPGQSLEAVKAARSIVIDASCASMITGGFESAALGSVYVYPSKQTDQLNLSNNVLTSFYPNLPADWTTPQMCMDTAGIWAYRPHTAAQIQQVGADAKAGLDACLAKNADLQAQIAAATDVESVLKITW